MHSGEVCFWQGKEKMKFANGEVSLIHA